MRSFVDQPPSAADKVSADMRDDGREDWGYTHECRALNLKALLSFMAPEHLLSLLTPISEKNWGVL